MGLDLGKLQCPQPFAIDAVAGKRVAIDVPNLMYPFFLVRHQQGTDRDAAAAWALRGVLARVFKLALHGARSILVVDGAPHPLKRATLEARDRQREAKGQPRLTPDDYARLEPLADALGVPFFVAPHDAEAQCAWFCQEELADVVATTDWDALVFGADELLRGMSGPEEKWTSVRWADVSRELDVGHRGVLAAAAVLIGSDYGRGVRGVGPVKALRMARECNGELDRHASAGDVLRDLPEWRASLEAFTTPTVNDAYRPAWSRPSRDAAALLEAMGKAPNASTFPEVLARMSLLHDPAAPARTTGMSKQVTLGGFAS